MLTRMGKSLRIQIVNSSLFWRFIACYFLQEPDVDSLYHVLFCVCFGQLLLTCFAENAPDAEKVSYSDRRVHGVFYRVSIS